MITLKWDKVSYHDLDMHSVQLFSQHTSPSCSSVHGDVFVGQKDFSLLSDLVWFGMKVEH